MNSRKLRDSLCKELSSVSDCASFEADQLLLHFTGQSRAELLTGNAELPEETCCMIWQAVQKRQDREPLQYLLGQWDFYGRTFHVGKGVLIPRADTETLVEVGLSFAGSCDAPVIADLCAGTGCIAVTMALEMPDASVWAVEKSEDALGYLRKNVGEFCAPVEICGDDVLCPRGEYPQFDLILSNPPYISDTGMEALQTEVRREPEMALWGGSDGLRFYRGMVEVWASRLKPGGMLAFEIGLGQEEAVRKIIENNCFEKVCFYRDLCGIIRVVTGLRRAD